LQNLMPRPAIDTPIAGRGIRYTPQNTSLCPSVGIRGRLQCSRHTQATWTDSDRRTNRLVQKLPFRKITPSKNYPFKKLPLQKLPLQKNYPSKKLPLQKITPSKITPSKKLPLQKNYLFKKLPFKKITLQKLPLQKNYPFKNYPFKNYFPRKLPLQKNYRRNLPGHFDFFQDIVQHFAGCIPFHFPLRGKDHAVVEHRE